MVYAKLVSACQAVEKPRGRAAGGHLLQFLILDELIVVRTPPPTGVPSSAEGFGRQAASEVLAAVRVLHGGQPPLHFALTQTEPRGEQTQVFSSPTC
jgi:hypothetical protein